MTVQIAYRDHRFLHQGKEENYLEPYKDGLNTGHQLSILPVMSVQIAQDVLKLHNYFKCYSKDWSEVFWYDKIHLNADGIAIITSRITRRAWVIVRDMQVKQG